MRGRLARVVALIGAAFFSDAACLPFPSAALLALATLRHGGAFGVALHAKNGANLRVASKDGVTRLAATTTTSSSDTTTTTPHNPYFDKISSGRPFDTALGASIIDFFIDGPEPATANADVSSNCPELTDFADEVTLDAPNPCSDDTLSKGKWSSNGDTELASWEQTCSLSDFTLMPVQKYRMPSGDLLGTSRMTSTVFGNYFKFKDCSGRDKVTLIESIYVQQDNAVYLQYELYNDSHTIARTGYMALFTNDFTLYDTAGTSLVTATRSGDWSPRSDECTTDARQWNLKFESTGPFAEAIDRWPVAEMVTLLSLRNRLRRDSGMVAYTWCTVGKSFFWFFIFCLLASLAIGMGVCMVQSNLIKKSQNWFHEAERKVLGHKKHIPTRHDETY